MRYFVSSLILVAAAGCAHHTGANGVLPQRDAALDCAEQLVTAAGFVPAPRDNALGATVEQDRREFLKWSPPGHWQDANEIQRIAAWVVVRGDSVGLRSEAYVMRKPSSQWTTAPEDARALAIRIQSSCTGQTPTP